MKRKIKKLVKDERYRFVELITCKNCVHFDGEICKFHSTKGKDLICRPNDFCSAGKRKKV